MPSRFRPPPTINGCGRRRPDSHRRGPRAQPQGRFPRASSRCPDRHHRTLRVRQVEPCLRHDLRRGPAALRRVPLGLRPAVPGPDGQARRRLDRGTFAGDLDRPEDDLPEPAVDGRHRHRDLRLPAPALGEGRASPLPQLRRADRRPVDRADRRQRDDASRGHPLHGAGPGRARAKGRVQGPARGAPRGGLHPRQDRRRAAPARGRHRARQEVQARHRGGRRPSRDEAGLAQASRGLGRDGGRAGRGHHRDREGAASRQGRAAEGRDGAKHATGALGAKDRDVLVFSEKFSCLACGTSMPELEPRIFSFNSPHGACPHCTGLGSQMEIDPDLVDRPEPVDQRGRDPALGLGRRLLRAARAGDRRQVRDRSRHALGGPARGRSGAVPLRRRGRARLRLVPEPDGAPPLLHGPAGRASCRASSAATARRTRSSRASASRSTCRSVPCPECHGRTAAAGEPRGEGRRNRDRRVHAQVGARGDGLARGARAERARSSRSPRGSSRRSSSACASSTRSGSAT